MSRVIKFRAWQDDAMLYSEGGLVRDNLKFFGRLYEDTVLMQFTGILDKKGKDIYEGDICRNKFGTTVEVVFGNFCIGTDDWGVEHKTPCFCFKFDDNSGYVGLSSECEIIGNIHEGIK